MVGLFCIVIVAIGCLILSTGIFVIILSRGFLICPVSVQFMLMLKIVNLLPLPVGISSSLSTTHSIYQPLAKHNCKRMLYHWLPQAQ